MKPITTTDIDARFTTHPVFAAHVKAMDAVRAKCKQAALFVIECCPPGHEQQQAVAALEAATFWANAGISRHADTSTDPAVSAHADDPNALSSSLRAIADGLADGLPVSYDEVAMLCQRAEQLEEALALGWRVVEVTTEQIQSGLALQWVRQALEGA